MDRRRAYPFFTCRFNPPNRYSISYLEISLRLTRTFQRDYHSPIMFHQRKPKTKVVTKLIRAMMAPFLHHVP